MKALRIDKRRLAVRDIDLPERGKEALVRVLLSGERADRRGGRGRHPADHQPH